MVEQLHTGKPGFKSRHFKTKQNKENNRKIIFPGDNMIAHLRGQLFCYACNSDSDS